MKNPAEKIFKIAIEFFDLSEHYSNDLYRSFSVTCTHGFDQVMFAYKGISIVIDGADRRINLSDHMFLDPIAFLNVIIQLETLLERFKEKLPEFREKRKELKRRELDQLEAA